MSDLAGIIKRVKEATGPDRTIDCDVEKAFSPDGYVPNYTASVDAVMALIVEKMPGAEWCLLSDPDKCHAVVYPATWADDALDYGGYGATPALALLLAFLRAWGKEGEESR